jgi:uncharacterized membrane protein
MKVEVSVEILRPADTVWPVLADVERWPEWTASVTKVERLDSNPFGLESRVIVRQPKLKALEWRVSDFRKGRLFSWEALSPGVSTIARHEIQPSPKGCIVTLTIDQKGWLAPIIKPFLIGITQRYMQMEAQGLKKRCEEPATVTAGRTH